MIRKQGKLEPVTWEEALAYTAQQFHEIKQKSGKEAIAGIGSARTTNEDNYLFQVFMRRELESPYLDSYNSFGYSAAIAALKEATGQVTPGFTPADIEKADLIMVIGCELPVELPVPSLEVIRAAREGKTKLINALPMGSKLDRFAHLRLRYKPGTEIQLLAGLIKLIVENNQIKYKDALKDQAFVKSLDNISLEKITQATGIDALQLQEAAGMIARAGITYFIAGHYLISPDNVTQAVQTLTNLALLQEAQVFIAPEKNNQFGALAMGVSPDWTIGLNQPAKTFSPVLPALEKGRIKALYLMGADILADYPGGQTLTKALEKLQFLVVQDVFPTKVHEYAHVVLPACTFAEKQGTVIDAWGRVQQVSAAVPPVGNSRPDWQIIAGIAGQMDNETMNYNGAAEITAEIATQWPGFPEKPEFPNPKTHKLYPLALPGETSGETLPYTLLIGPSLFHNGTLSTHAQGLLTLASGSVLEMNPEDMAALKIAAADEVKLISDAITLRVKIKAAPRMPRGVLFLPRHFDSIPAVFPAGKYPLVGVRIERY
jgi:predicted molibdopterin-dependent oxidoreductase YjgC